MLSRQRELLRLHLEAVWYIHLPPIVQNDVELLRGGPPWKVCLAELADERVAVWGPDVAAIEREGLLARLNEALSLPATASTGPDISREVALYQTASPTIELEDARRVARPLTEPDQALVERFEPGSVTYYFHPDRSPLIGVIVDGRLLCIAHSSRRTTEACELGIETLPEARRKGYALTATVLWAAAVAEEQFVPIYSASADNIASLRLAAAAGYRAFARVAKLHQ